MKKIICLLVLGLILSGICFAEDDSGKKVFANSREVSSKSSDGKSIIAMPDVCTTPPAPPAGPIPIPYPNTASASDTTKGSKKVKIDAKETMIKGDEYQQSESDEPGTDEDNAFGYKPVGQFKVDMPQIGYEPVTYEPVDIEGF